METLFLFHSLASHEIVVAFHQGLVGLFHHGDDRDDPGADDHDDHMMMIALI